MQMSTFEEAGVQSGEESIGGDQSQNSMGHLARLLGRPKSFSGREDEWHDWSLKFGATAATLSEHASLWMSDALRMNTEIVLDQPNQGSAKIFARQLYTLLIHLCEGRALALVRGAPDHNGLEAWRLLHEWYQPKTRSRGLALLNEILGWDFGSKEQFLQRMKDWENATLEYNRTSSAPLQEEVLVAVLISRSPKEVRTYLHVQVREDTAKLSHVRQLLYDYLRAGKAWKAPRTEETAETNSVPMDVDALHREGGKGKNGKGKGKFKGDRNKHDGKGKGKQPVRQRHFDGNCNQCGAYGHKKSDYSGKSKFFNGTCNKCGAHGHKKSDCPVKSVAHLESTPVSDPSDEPVGMESLEWLFALETRDGNEELASLANVSNPVRLLLDSGSGVSACSPDFAPHVQTHTESSVRARSATGQVTKSLGKKTVKFDMNGIASSVNMEVLKISKPIMSAGKVVRSGRKIVLDEHDSYIEDKKTGTRIPVELTRGDVFEVSAHVSSRPRSLLEQPVLICPNEVDEAEDPGYEELDESVTVSDEVPRGMAVPETPSAKEREGHELTHVPSQPWCSVCVRAKGVDMRHLRKPAGRRAEDQGVDHLSVIQFDYAYVSSGDARGQQVKMRTILDTSTGYGTACVIDVKGAGDKYATSSAVSFLKELGYTRFRCRTDPEPAIKSHVDNVIKCLADDRVVEQVLPEETIPESHASLGALEGWHGLLQGQIRALRLDVEERLGSVVDTTHQCLPWLVRHASWLLNRFQRRQNGATAFENLKRVSYNKPLLQFGERCHWLEAERITHKFDPRWGIGVWLGRHTASDAHLIGTPGGVIQVRTVRRLTREQRTDDVSKRAFDNFMGSPQNLSGSKPSLQEQTVHGEKWTWTPGCKGCMWSRRGYHHTKACDARKRAFLVARARAEELRVTEAESWKKPSSAMPSSSTISGSEKNEEVQPESADQHAAPNAEPTIDSEMPDSDATRRTRISTKRPDPGKLKEEVPKRLRIVTKQSRPLWMATDTVSEQPEKRARIPETHAEVDPETFALTLESRGTMETYTELNVAASDLHESDLEEVWSNDLGLGSKVRSAGSS